MQKRFETDGRWQMADGRLLHYRKRRSDRQLSLEQANYTRGDAESYRKNHHLSHLSSQMIARASLIAVVPQANRILPSLGVIFYYPR